MSGPAARDRRGDPVVRPGVIVLGMHRSGTSVTTHALHRLGLSAGDPGGLLPARPDNPHGYWETRLLSELNETILQAHGGTWSAPPALRPGWSRMDRASVWAGCARERFMSAFGGRGAWVWKDPRTCLLLEFWRGILPAATVLVVIRDPVSIAESLRHRDGMSRALALALWERHLRSALHGARGRSVLVSVYDSLVDRPAQWLDGVMPLLHAVGVRPSVDAVDVLRQVVRPSLRHSVRGPSSLAAHTGVSEQQAALYRHALSLAGWHERLTVEVPEEETPATEDAIARARLARSAMSSQRTQRVHPTKANDNHDHHQESKQFVLQRL